MEREKHEILGGRAYIFKRDETPYWYAAAYMDGKNYRHSTKLTDLNGAIRDAEEWYISLRGKAEVGTLPQAAAQGTEPTFREVADLFMKEYSILTEGQRSPRWVQGHEIRLRIHLLPFFGDIGN